MSIRNPQAAEESLQELRQAMDSIEGATLDFFLVPTTDKEKTKPVADSIHTLVSLAHIKYVDVVRGWQGEVPEATRQEFLLQLQQLLSLRRHANLPLNQYDIRLEQIHYSILHKIDEEDDSLSPS